MDIPFRSIHRPVLVVLCLLIATSLAVALSGCGQPAALSSEAKETRTLEIAADYAQDNDLAQAQARLGELNIANTTQWVTMLAERYITEAGDDDVARQLGLLAQAMGSGSGRVAHYLAPPTPIPTATPTAEPTPTPPPPTPTPEVPTPTPAAELPTPTPNPPTSTSDPPTSTPIPKPQVVVKSNVNVRSGPGTAYPRLGTLEAGQQFDIVGRNQAGDWWQICCLAGERAWVTASLVDTAGPTDTVSVATDIPPLPATPTPSPPTATPAPAKPSVDYRIVSQRLLTVEENGGRHAGYSVNCGEKHEIRIVVLDAAGNPLNNAVVVGKWNSNPPQVTGSKGEGRAEFVIANTTSGDELYVQKDPDGREVASEVGMSMTTRPEDIPRSMLEEAGYCTEPGKCDDPDQLFLLCRGHFSWEIVFQRTW